MKIKVNLHKTTLVKIIKKMIKHTTVLPCNTEVSKVLMSVQMKNREDLKVEKHPIYSF